MTYTKKLVTKRVGVAIYEKIVVYMQISIVECDGIW